MNINKATKAKIVFFTPKIITTFLCINAFIATFIEHGGRSLPAALFWSSVMTFIVLIISVFTVNIAVEFLFTQIGWAKREDFWWSDMFTHQ